MKERKPSLSNDATPDVTEPMFETGHELDLHTFRPRDIASVVEEYLWEAHEKGYRHVRIIHGKGIGYQRETVRTILAKTKYVVTFGDDSNGNWGATWAELAAPENKKGASTGA